MPTDTERLDWLSKQVGASLCEFLFKCGFRIPLTGELRPTIDAAMQDAAQFHPKGNSPDLFGASGTAFSGNPGAYGGPPGSGPKGKTCKDCRHAVGSGNSRTYWKCDLVPHTSGPGTDIRLRTPACRLFEPEPEKEKT